MNIGGILEFFFLKTRCYVPVFLTILYIHVYVPEYYPPPFYVLWNSCRARDTISINYDLLSLWFWCMMATLRSFLYSNAFKTSNWSYLVCRGFRNRCFVNSSIPSATGKSFSPIPESILKSKVFCSSEMHLPYTRKYLASLLFVRFYFYFWGGTTTLF